MAAGAGVDAALVHHYFGTKEQLFAAAFQFRSTRWTVIGPMREVPVDELGFKLPSVLLPIWDSELGAGSIATLRSLLAGSDVSLAVPSCRRSSSPKLAPRVDNPPGTGMIRAQFFASQLVGVVMARYIVQLEPFASLPSEQIAQTIAPNLQRYLTGDLPDGLAP